MFGSNNPFGQSSTSPFGSPSVFGQNSATNNPFAPKPFGSSNPFGSQTGTSIFGGTSTGVFGASQSSSPFSSTTTFGASSTPAFGSSSTPAFGASSTPAFGASSTPAFGASSTPTFGASSTPAFGSSSSPFGGSSVFGQKPSFGSFGSTSTQTSPFGNTSQPSQPSFGSSIFGSSTPFGGSSQPAFGATGSPAFGATSTPAFGATSTPAFGATSTPSFGSTTSPTFGATNTAFGASSAPVFGSSSTPAFGASSTPLFGSSSTPAFGASSTPSFGTPSTPAFVASSTPSFGASSTPSFSFGSTPAFGQSASAFGSSPFGTGSSPFGAQSSAFGLQSTTPSFATSSLGQSGFGGQRGGSRITAYTPTTESDAGQAGGQAGKLESISAMPVYKDKSHEELRWEDYQLGDKGGPAPSAQSTGAVGFGSTTQPNPFGSPSTFGQSSASPFSSSTTSNLFGQKPSTYGSGFGATSGSTFASSGFGSSFSTAPSLFSSSTSAFGTTSSALNFGSSPSIFNSSQAPGTSSPFGSSFGSTQPSQLFNTTGSQIGQTPTAFGQTTSLFGQSTTPAFSQSNPFGTSSSFGGNMFTGNATPFGQSTLSLSTSFQPAQPPQTTSSFSFGNFGPTQTFGAGSGAPGMFSQSSGGLQSATQSTAVMQPVPVTNPFGTLPAMPQISIGQGGSAPSIQYGISSMPATEKPALVRISSLLTSRHLSQRRTKLPLRKYYPKSEALKVPFFSDDEDTTTTPKADALFIPRENPRALVISHMEPRSAKASEQAYSLMGRSNANGNAPELMGSPTTRSNAERRDQDSLKSVGAMEQVLPINVVDLISNGYKEDQSPPKEDSYVTLRGHRAGEAAIVYEHGADIETLMPKLRRSDYFTEPRIQELAAKGRAEPGFLGHVKDFIVGRHGYGSIKFLGETDVRRLDLESLVEFNNREVIVYMDDSKKPPVGQGLNKPAEVTLLNIKCFDKKAGRQYTEGPKIEKYKEMLKKKAEDQGAEFISYDPIKGEWKFRVSHFSSYSFLDGDD